MAQQTAAAAGSDIQILTADRGPNLYRAICAHAGTPLVYTEEPGQRGPGEIVVGRGYLSPYRAGGAVRAALGDDQAEVWVFRAVGEDGLERSVTWVAWAEDEPRAACLTLRHGS